MRFQAFPPISNECPELAVVPCQQNPRTTKVRIAIPHAQRDVRSACAALRDRPSPELSNAIPVHASGTSRISRKQRIAVFGLTEGTGNDSTSFCVGSAVRTDRENQSNNLDCKSRK